MKAPVNIRAIANVMSSGECLIVSIFNNSLLAIL
jgi:hypothetical protein